ncbi:carcinoembryonic antigen-related cell adhesion molecule 4-like [Heptranchias perlo]|uniref:carcinoembryonic antigen-related cell adhesion molecule 4-like n=1 Tax=Heptranchias perlo TaxID=212740 RepID=UPI00355AC026
MPRVHENGERRDHIRWNIQLPSMISLGPGTVSPHCPNQQWDRMERHRLGTAALAFLLSIQLIAPVSQVSVDALKLDVSLNPVTGTANRSVLLPVSYVSSNPSGYVRMNWDYLTGGLPVLSYSASHPAASSSTQPQTGYTSERYKHRVLIYPNASLLIHNLQLSDSGVYQITVTQSQNIIRATINLTVTSAPVSITPVTAGQSTIESNNLTSLIVTVSVVASVSVLAFICLFLLLLSRRKRKRKERGGAPAVRDDSPAHEKVSIPEEPWIDTANVIYVEMSWAESRNLDCTGHRTGHQPTEYTSVRSWCNRANIPV